MFTRFLLLLIILTSATLCSAGQLRLLSYNIHHGEGNDRKIDLKRIATFIKKQNPDIVFLQEVDRHCQRTGDIDQPAELEKLTGLKSFFVKFMDFQGGQYGQCILTRLPMVRTQRVALPSGLEPRASAAATLRTGEDQITVANIHFYRTEAERLSQARQLSTALSSISHPVFLVGDFNSRPGDQVMNFLGKNFSIPEKDGPQKFTFSAENPRIEIDYVLFRPANAYKVIEYRVIEEKVMSDHYPLICVLEKAED